MAEKPQAKTKHSFFDNPGISLVNPADWNAAKPLAAKLQKLIETAVAGKYPETAIELEYPNEEKYGEYSTNVALQLAQKTGKPPREVAEDLLALIKKSPEISDIVSKVEVAGPGFLNFFLKPEVLAEEVLQVAAKQENYGNNKILAGKRIMFEYAHPNPFKAFHIGHLRNIILGESLIRILEAQGAEMIRTNYQGDVGMHIAKCLWAFKKIDERDYPQNTTARVQLIAKCYVEGAAAYEDPELQKEIVKINKLIYTKEDPEINKLWNLGRQWSLDKFHELYSRVYSTFVREYMESETLPLIAGEIEKGVKLGILTKSKGALIFDGAKYGIDTRVYYTSEGLPTYEGKQLALVPLMEFKDFGKLDLLIFNVAVEQISYFKSTIKAIELINPDLKGKQYHNAYEFVGLKKGKMSSRKGNVVLGEDILDQAEAGIAKVLSSRDNEEFTPEEQKRVAGIIGVGAIKYSFLNISPFSYLAFDLESSLNFDGNSGPYLQYTYARANRMLHDAGRTAGEKDSGKGIRLSAEKLSGLLADELEIAVLKQVFKFPEVVIEAGKHLSPNLLCSYLFELAQRFNLFYKHKPVLKETNEELRAARLLLTEAAATIMQNGLYLLGIKTVEKM